MDAMNRYSHFFNRKYDEALEFHQRALILSPQNASTFTAIGYVYSLTGNSALAVDYFHKVISFLIQPFKLAKSDLKRMAIL